MSLVLKGFNCFEGTVEAPEILPERPSLKLPWGGTRKLEGGLWKASVGLVLRDKVFETERERLDAMSLGGVMVSSCSGYSLLLQLRPQSALIMVLRIRSRSRCCLCTVRKTIVS